MVYNNCKIHAKYRELIPKNYNLICVLGPTASGKTSYAAELAYVTEGEIISADSRQVYRNMNIGTGKDLDEYKKHGRPVPYHLIDIIEPGKEYNVYEFQKDFINAFRDIRSRDKMAVLCGGSGLYIEAVLSEYRLISVPVNIELRKDLESKPLQELEKILRSYKIPHNTTDTLSRKRAIRAIEIEAYYSGNSKVEQDFPVFHYIIFGIDIDRETRRRRITERLRYRLENGMLEEAEALVRSGITHEKLEFYGLEYRYLSQYIRGKLSYDEMFSGLNTAIHQFAKRQMTWFRRMEKKGFKIHWLDGKLSAEELVNKSLEILEDPN